MGIVNVTPDSFSDGGAFYRSGKFEPGRAIAHGLRLMAEGADLVDVGGESTRPGSEPVAADDELDRVIPVVEGLVSGGAVVSIDTSKVAVARAALDRGAHVLNDVTGLRDPALRRIVAEGGAGVVVMHMQGTPPTMQREPSYTDVVAEVRNFLVAQAQLAERDGIEASAICIDPGIGFGKTFEHNLALLAELEALVDCGYPVMLGASRKGFLGALLRAGGVDTSAVQRDPATAATTALAVAAGVRVVRVHDVAIAQQVVLTADAIVRRRRRIEGT